MVKSSLCAVLLFLFAVSMNGCSSGQSVSAVPAGLDLANVPTTSVAMTAVNFHFTPDIIRVKPETLVEITITATGGTHGFAVKDFGIDETIHDGETKTVRFYVREKGEIGFHCSHFCGLGHFGMNGKVIVE